MRFINNVTYGGKNYDIAAIIQRRRLQLLIHSRIYYILDKNIISDATFNQWAAELKELQLKYQEESKQVCFYKEFEDWDGNTGCMLPLENPWVINKAQILLLLKGETNGTNKQERPKHKETQQQTREKSIKSNPRKKATKQRGNSLF